MLLSIVIPCYNASLYVKRTLDSILCQDLSDVELILVNDGSEDNTLLILNSYADRFNNIVVISQSNQGVSASRNIGMQRAIGDYISFIDADDIVTSDYVKDIKMIVSQNHYNVVCFGFKYFKTQKNIINHYPKNRTKTLLYDYLTNKVHHSIVSVVYRKSFLTDYNIKFDETTYYGEDTEFLIKVFVHVKVQQIFMYNKVLYHYLYNSNSAMHKKGYNFKKFTTVLSSLRSMEYIKKYTTDVKIINAIYNRTLYKIIAGYRMSNGCEFFNSYRDMLKTYPPFSNSLFYLYNIFYVTKNKLFLN